jgi:SpoVK/Ycf46/Vps4 family AAA+-type ATPase
VRQAKDQIVAQEYAGLLEILDPRFGFEAVGGMSELKAWFQAEVISPLRAGRTDVPMGVLFVGPPGTGKTLFVRALAKEAGFNCVALRMENILGGIVGTSERNLARALAIIRSLSPVILFVDELDQTDVSSRGQGSGNPVAGNLFNQLLQFLSDGANRGKVIFIGASNRPDLIDGAFKRFGRVDAIIPVLLPDEDERAAIALASATTQGYTLDAAALPALRAGTDRWSGADVAALVGKAGRLTKRQGSAEIGLGAMQQALALLRPASPKMADYYRALALNEVTDLEFVPVKDRALLDDRAALKKTIDAEAGPRRGGRELF